MIQQFTGLGHTVFDKKLLRRQMYRLQKQFGQITPVEGQEVCNFLNGNRVLIVFVNIRNSLTDVDIRDFFAALGFVAGFSDQKGQKLKENSLGIDFVLKAHLVVGDHIQYIGFRLFRIRTGEDRVVGRDADLAEITDKIGSTYGNPYITPRIHLIGLIEGEPVRPNQKALPCFNGITACSGIKSSLSFCAYVKYVRVPDSRPIRIQGRAILHSAEKHINFLEKSIVKFRISLYFVHDVASKVFF